MKKKIYLEEWKELKEWENESIEGKGREVKKRLTEGQKKSAKEKWGVKDGEKRRKQEEGGVKRLRWRGEREREKKEVDDEKGIMALS